MQKNRNFLYDNLVMTNEQLLDLIYEEREKISADEIVDTICNIIAEINANCAEELKLSTPIEKLVFIANEMYIRGYGKALYYFNESLKLGFSE